MKFAGVRFLSNNNKHVQVYDYISIEGVDVGEIVLVPTRYGLSAAQVVEMRETSTVKAAMTVMNIISDSSPVFQDMRDKVQRKELHKKIETRIKEINEVNQYEEYAKIDPKIRELTDKLKSLS